MRLHRVSEEELRALPPKTRKEVADIQIAIALFGSNKKRQ